MKSPFSFSTCLVSKILVSNMFFGIVSRVLVPSAAALLPIAVSFAQTEFNGTYAGTVCGDGKETGLTFPLTLTVANGVVSSTINGLPSGTVSATGTVSASGSVTFSVSGACGGGTITFTGVVTTSQSGGAVMIGSADQPAGGTCAGFSRTWKATRTTTSSDVRVFDGTYTGTACGDGNETGLTFPLTLTAANGVISGTINGRSSTGTVSASGSATFSVTGACGGGTITFTGVATTNQSGGAVMIGSADQPAGGTCTGFSRTWKATRTTTTSDVRVFNGSYTGTVCGDGKETGLTFPLTLTVANGVVSSTINGLPSGTVSASGSVTFSVTGACGGGTITFTGVVTTSQSGGAVMIGSADQPAGGTCAGSSSTWKATRTMTTGVVVESEIPATLALLQSYPNPFNPTATIEYHVPVSGFVKLSVYNILGREITLLVNENKSVGNHRVTFDASGLPGGVYFYRMQAGQFQETRRLVLLK